MFGHRSEVSTVWLPRNCCQELTPGVDEASVDASARTLFGSLIRDPHQDGEQAEILHLAQQSCCELPLDKVSEDALDTDGQYLALGEGFTSASGATVLL